MLKYINKIIYSKRSSVRKGYLFGFLHISLLSTDVPQHVQDGQVSGFNVQRSLTEESCHVKVKVVYTFSSLKGMETSI